MFSLLTACGAPAVFATGAGPADEVANSCDTITAVPTAVAATYGLDTGFYQQHCSVYGVPILSSANVDGTVLQEAGRLATAVLGGTTEEVRNAIHDRYLHIIITADEAGESFEDLPGLYDLYPEEAAAAGLGPTPDFPAVIVRDSIVSCRPRFDRPNVTPPGDTLVHELGHALLSMGLLQTPDAYGAYLLNAYEDAVRNDTWVRALPADVAARLSASPPLRNYMMTNVEEYFATGVSSYIGFKGITIAYELRRLSSQLASLSEVQVHGPNAIAAQDPALAALLQQALPNLQAPEHLCPEWLEPY